MHKGNKWNVTAECVAACGCVYSQAFVKSLLICWRVIWRLKICSTNIPKWGWDIMRQIFYLHSIYIYSQNNLCVYIYIYIYIGSISPLMQISLNIIDILWFNLNYPVGETYNAPLWYKFNSSAFKKTFMPNNTTTENSHRQHNNIRTSK